MNADSIMTEDNLNISVINIMEGYELQKYVNCYTLITFYILRLCDLDFSLFFDDVFLIIFL